MKSMLNKTRLLLGRALKIKRRPIPIDFNKIEVSYVDRGDIKNGAVNFGGTEAEYKLWRSNMCGVCCLKMIGDSVGKTQNISLFDLVKISLDRGVFRINKEGNIEGAFHYPLRDLLREMHIPATVESKLTTQKIKKKLQAGKIIILSVDLTKSHFITSPESHLITVYDYDALGDTYTIHDSSSVIAENGNAVKIHSAYLNELSNSRGLSVG